jgi:hypothetical protein
MRDDDITTAALHQHCDPGHRQARDEHLAQRIHHHRERGRHRAARTERVLAEPGGGVYADQVGEMGYASAKARKTPGMIRPGARRRHRTSGSMATFADDSG